jgi:hypothetical protein
VLFTLPLLILILVAVSALRASILLLKDFLFPSKNFSFLLVSWFSPLKSVFIGFLWPAAGLVLLLSGGQALLASRPVACFSISGFSFIFLPLRPFSRQLGIDSPLLTFPVEH